MANFFGNNLKPEESLAGYNVGEPDDDIFQIKDSEYPENIEEFVYKEPEVPVENLEIDNQSNNEVIDEVDDFIKPDPIFEEINSNINEIIEEGKPTSDDDNIWSSFGNDDDNNNDDLLSSVSKNPIDIIEELKKDDLDETVSDEIDILETKNELSLELDDDFKRQLAEQLEAKKAKKKEESLPENEQNSQNQIEEFVPIEESDNAQYYDLSNFGNERASEKNITKEVDNNSKNNDTIETKKKEKSKLPWILSISAASIILIAGLAYLIMYYLIPNFYQKEELAKKDSTHKVENISAKKIEKEKVKPVEEKDTTKEVEKEVKKETEEEIIARINKEFASKQEKKTEEVIKKDEKIVEKPKEEIKIEKKKEIAVKKEEKKIEKPKVEKPVIKEKPVIAKETKILPKKEEKKIDIVKETKPITEVKKEENIIEQVYTIQVYSSPSKEDAMDWVEKLKSKNINASLSEQMIRDVKWYRVRFGSFSTREEAKAVALRNGFSQTWIDRVK